MENEIQAAYEFAKLAHYGQERKFTGEPYIVHPQETSEILWGVTDGKRPIEEYIAAILHDVVEDTDTTLEEIRRIFGQTVRDLVSELTNKRNIAGGKAAYLARKMNAMSGTALDIKLCDRLSNITGLEDTRIPTSFCKRYMLETHYILENLDRDLTLIQKDLTARIHSMLLFLKINRNL